jgi:hypothetical protein
MEVPFNLPSLLPNPVFAFCRLMFLIALVFKAQISYLAVYAQALFGSASYSLSTRTYCKLGGLNYQQL